MAPRQTTRKKVYRHARKTTWPFGSLNLRETRLVGPKRLFSFDVELFGDRTLRRNNLKWRGIPREDINGDVALDRSYSAQREWCKKKLRSFFCIRCSIRETERRTTNGRSVNHCGQWLVIVANGDDRSS
jgi:hypothetical protein